MSVMKRARAIDVANRFAKLDIHEDSLISITIHPPHSAKNLSRIEFGLKDDATGRVKILSFQSCANVRFMGDFDVLAHNWHFGNTKALAAKTDAAQLRKFVMPLGVSDRCNRLRILGTLRQLHADVFKGIWFSFLAEHGH